jgi:hypothetical protein
MPRLTLKVGEERPIATPKAFLNILSASAQFVVESPDIGVLTGKTNRHFEMGNYRNVFFVNNTDAPIDIDYEIANIRTTSSGESNVNVNNEVVVKRISEGINVAVDAVIQDGNVTVDAMPAVDVSSMPAVTVEAMPAVAVSSLPAVTVDSMPAMTVLSATANTHKPRIECLPGQAIKLFDSGTRKSCRLNIRSDQTNGVSLGSDGLVNDSNGGFLDVGMVDYMDTSGELWAFNAGSSSVLVDVLELV